MVLTGHGVAQGFRSHCHINSCLGGCSGCTHDKSRLAVDGAIANSGPVGNAGGHLGACTGQHLNQEHSMLRTSLGHPDRVCDPTERWL